MDAFNQFGSYQPIEDFAVGNCPGAARRTLISIPNGFHLRQFVHSGILDLLVRRGLQILVVSPNWEPQAFTAQLPRKSVEVRTVEIEDGPLRRRYWAARKHLIFSGPATATLRYKLVDLRKKLPSAALAAQIGNGLLRHTPSLRRRVLRWERLILRDKGINALLSAEPVDLVLLGSPGYTALDALLLHAAVNRSIPVVVAVLSWDNLSSKGGINPMPDRLLVSTEYMRSEAIKLHSIPAERIIETGAPLYDAFANSSRFGSRAENLRRLHLDPKRRLIVYGTNHAGFFPDEVQVVRRVAQWVEEDALGEPCQLWVRLHPQAVTGPYKVPVEPYSRLSSERVKVEFPPVRESSSLLWDIPKNDLGHLVMLLRDADVVINTASTLSIDAAVLDRPVICIAFDPAGDLPYEKSVRRYYEYTHMANVVRAGAAQVVTSPDDLQKKITRYLKNPALDREGRRQIVEQQIGRVDGRSAVRVVKAVLELLPTKGGDRILNNIT